MNRHSDDSSLVKLVSKRERTSFGSTRPLPADYHLYDYCMVFDADNQSLNDEGTKIVNKIVSAGFVTKAYFSLQRDEIVLLIGVDSDHIKAFADLIDYQMLLDEENLEKMANLGDPEKHIAPISIPYRPDISPMRPYESIYGKYDTTENLQPLYFRPHGGPDPFRSSVRLKLINLMLQAHTSEGGCELPLRKLVVDKTILAYFPLHNVAELEGISSKMLRSWPRPWSLPLWDLKEYFGEKLGLYFAFVGFITTWMLAPAIVGLCIECHVAYSGNTSAASVPFFAALVSFWAVLMTEFWKRNEKSLALRWGTIGFEAKQEDRPEFHGEKIASFIDGKETLYFPPNKRNQLVCESFTVIFAMAMVVIVAVGSIFVIRAVLTTRLKDDGLTDDNAKSYASTISSVLNAIQIQVLNFLYGKLADRLTDRENHRTDTEYEDSLIAKLFMFQFVNSYASFVYVAFIQPYVESDAPSPMDALALNLTIVFGTRLLLSNTLEAYLPFYLARQRFLKETAGVEGELTQPEMEYVRLPYDTLKGMINDYAELALQYGYLAIFVTAFPAAPFLAFLSNTAEIRSDAYKMIRVFQRPVLTSAEDIGTWQTIFEFISTVSVVSNSALVCFTMSTFDGETKFTRVWLFICFQYFIFSVTYVFAVLVPDEPEEVQIQLARQDFLVEKVLEKHADEDDSDLLMALRPRTGAIVIVDTL